MILGSIPSAGVHRDTATSTDPDGLVGAAPLNGQTGLFIYSKEPVQVWQRSAAGAWSVAATLTGAVGSRKHSINWDDLTRIYVKSTSGSDATVRFVGQTTSAPIAQGATVNTWSGLTDTPSAYVGQGGKYPKVKVDESGIEFVESAGGGGGSPATPVGSLQYNNNGSFAGTNISYDSTKNNVGIGTSTFDPLSDTTLNIASGTPPSAGTPSQCSIYTREIFPEGVYSLLCHMDGTDGGTVFTDSSSFQNNGSAVGAVTTQTGVKKFGTAAAAFGSNDGISIPNSENYNFGTGDFTIEMWVKPASTPEWTVLLSNWTSANQSGYEIRLYGTSIRWMNNNVSAVVVGPDVVANAWNHIVVTRESGFVRIFLNGILGGTGTDTTNINTANDLILGRRDAVGYGYSLDGLMDEVRILKNNAEYKSNFDPPQIPYNIAAGYSELYVMDENGNETNVSPHNSDLEWEFFSKNTKTGRCVRVNMEKMIKRLEELHPGEVFMDEWFE